ncbi:ATP-binding protein [Intrasporangium calvum]|uniref:ATP-binding protein n=1 Tax=Intrasporangium calvum TaxID=53358 RepID=UPI0019004804|nr:ATP-binding protein [Intrasporangium calvum]
MRHHFTLGDLLQSGQHGPGRVPVGQVDYLRLDTGPRSEDTRQVISSGIRLFRHDELPVAVRILGRNPHVGREAAVLEVLAPEHERAERLVARLRALMDERSILRGQVITLAADPYGPGLAGATFLERPGLTAADIVLPTGTLDRIEHHVLGIGRQRARLQRHGQHLKRGVLLYGPPGTGKTHTVRYLLSVTPGTTAVLLSGGALQHIHAAAKIAPDLVSSTTRRRSGAPRDGRRVDEPVEAGGRPPARVDLHLQEQRVDLVRHEGRDDGGSARVRPLVVRVGPELELVQLDEHVVDVRVPAQLDEGAADVAEGEVLGPVRGDAPLTVVAVEELLEGDGHLGLVAAPLPDMRDQGVLLDEIHAVEGPSVERHSVGYTDAACRRHLGAAASRA